MYRAHNSRKASPWYLQVFWVYFCPCIYKSLKEQCRNFTRTLQQLMKPNSSVTQIEQPADSERDFTAKDANSLTTNLGFCSSDAASQTCTDANEGGASLDQKIWGTFLPCLLT